MAWTVKKCLLTPKVETEINKSLWLEPKNNYTGGNETPVKCFTADQEHVQLPFSVGQRLFPDSRVGIELQEGNTGWDFTGQLLPHQVSIVEEVMNNLTTNGSANANTFCGSGKTVMGIACGAKINQMLAEEKVSGSTIIVYSLSILADQWLETVTKYSNAKALIVQSGAHAETLKYGDADIYLCMIDSISKLPAEIRNSCQMLIGDEAHLLCTELRLSKLLTINPLFVLLLTATCVKINGLERMMTLLAGDKATVRVSTKPFTVWRLNTGINPPFLMNKQGRPDWNAMVKWLVDSERRNQLITELVLANPTRKIAIMTNRTEHVKKLQTMLTSAGESVGVMCGNISKYEKCRVLIGNIPKMGTGFDEKSACQDFDGQRIDLLIMAMSTKQIEQPAGRAFRAEKPHIIHLVDKGPIFNKHFEICKDWYLHPERKDKVTINIIDKIITIPNDD